MLFRSFVSILFTTFAHGEFYQYTDESGKLCFTDDISKIPRDERDAVKKHESVSQATKTIDTTTQPVNRFETASSDSIQKSENNNFPAKIVELKVTQAELNQIRMALENEQTAVESQAPVKGATKEERNTYSLKVEALNIKIVEYEKKLTVFNNQVAELNASKKERAVNIK